MFNIQHTGLRAHVESQVFKSLQKMEVQVLAGMKEVKEAVEAWSEGHSHDVRTVWTPSL